MPKHKNNSINNSNNFYRPKKESKFLDIPEDIHKDVISKYLDIGSHKKLSQTCKYFYSSYRKPLLAFNGQKLLKHVLFGERKHAAAILKSQPELLFYKGDVNDYAGRTIVKATPFELAWGGFDYYIIDNFLSHVRNKKNIIRFFRLSQNRWTPPSRNRSRYLPK